MNATAATIMLAIGALAMMAIASHDADERRKRRQPTERREVGLESAGHPVLSGLMRLDRLRTEWLNHVYKGHDPCPVCDVAEGGGHILSEHRADLTDLIDEDAADVRAMEEEYDGTHTLVPQAGE